MTRFYVLEHSGYTMGHGRAHDQWPVTEVLVLDRAYSHRMVWSSLTDEMVRSRPLSERRAKAARIAAELQAECGEA